MIDLYAVPSIISTNETNGGDVADCAGISDEGVMLRGSSDSSRIWRQITAGTARGMVSEFDDEDSPPWAVPGSFE